MKKIISIIGLLTFGGMLSLLSGCATIVDGTHQKIQVLTPPVKDASCSLSNDKGEWALNSTPGYVVVRRSKNNLVVACQKPGYLQTKTQVAADLNKMVFGNFIFGSIPGVIIDAVDQAIDAYPNTIQVPMKSNGL